MTVYRDLWWAVCLPVVLLGLTVALLLSPAALTVVLLTFAIIGAAVSLSRAIESADRPLRDRVGPALRGALLGGSAAGALVGYTVLLGAGVLLLVGLVLVSSPYSVRVYRRWLTALPTSSSDQPSVALDELTDEQLCQAWRASYAALQRQSSAARAATAVAERQRYLDELERRNADGFAAWLASGAHSPGDPLPYLTGNRAEAAEINWDELTRGRER